ncbi:hypothetical protein GCM10017620_24570 [Brevundimonas intermedia]|uniref:Fibronectin type-III domain-containing protein n=1 Tax=Brevundimonas intermedia TaxID=74315 RepID=A0ABQ5TBN9_9CAUL|nr:hypothetical protein [Brevundimonas intermedia]GLK49484.1 hypothetical protein GCM10017620_24570 [Brevundimonas intermedia]
MGKALKTAGVIIGAAALIATGVGALAMPGLAGSTTLFGISTGTLNTISSGLVAVGGMLDKPKSQGSAQPDEWTSSPDQPTPFLFGRMGVAGKIVQRDEFGPDNMYQGIVGIISGAGPIKGIQSFKGDDQAVTFGSNGIAVSSQWQGEMWMVRRAGNQPDTVLTVPAGLKSGGQSFEWSSSAKLSGKACYLQVLGENSKGTAYPAGIPDPVHVGEGIYGYDPRYDSTYAGGDGFCRLGVRSTYRYIEDPIIAGLNWALGMVENGQVVGGVGASIDGIDVPAFVEAANISEANGWKVAAWPDTSEDASSVLDQFLQAGGAVRARHAGKISCVSRGAPRASVVTVTGRDMAGSIELNTAPSLFDQLNTITPRFMSEAGGWKLTPADPVSFAAYVTDDGGKHSDQIDYRFCPLLKQAAELAAYDILDAREPFSGSVPLKPHMRLLKRGDCFVIDEPGVLLDGVKCIVLSRSYDPKTAQVRIGFRSETDSKHALALGKTTTLPDFPTLTPTDPTFVSPPEAGDWTITPRPPSTGGGQLPGFDLSGVVSNDTATAIIVEHGPTSAGPWTQAYQGPPTVTNIPIDGLQSGETYYIAVQYQRNQNYSERHVYGPYTSPVLDPGPNAPTLAEIFGDIGDLDDALALFDGDLAALEGELSAQGADIASLEVAVSDETSARAVAIREIQAAASGGSINSNPNFAAFPDAVAVPSGWSAWGRQDNARVTGRFSAYGFQQHDNTGGVQEDCGLVQTSATCPGLSAAAPGYYVIEADVRLLAGGYRGAGVLLYAGSFGVGSVATLHMGDEPDVNGQVGNTTALPSRSFRKLIRLENVSDGGLTLHLMTNWNGGFGIQDPKVIAWDHCAVRPATDAEIAAGTVLPGLSASVTNAQQAIVDLAAGKASAAALTATQAQVDDLDAETFILQTSVADVTSRLSTAQIDIRAAVGSTPAMVQLKDSASGSVLAMVAQSLLLGTYDSGGTLVEVLRLVGTKARFSGDVEIDGDLLLGGTLNGSTKIEKGTVRPYVSSYAAGTVTLSGTAPSEVAEVIIETSGSPVIVEFLALMDMQHAPASSFTMYVETRRQRLDGAEDTQVQYEYVAGAGDTADNFTGKWPIKLRDIYATPNTWRYYVRVWTSASNMSVKDIRNRFMSAEEDLTNT